MESGQICILAETKPHMRLAILLSGMVAAVPCTAQTIIKVPLSPAKGFALELSVVSRPTFPLASNEDQKALAQQLGLDSFITVMYPHNPRQYYDQELQQNRLDQDKYLKLTANLNYDVELSPAKVLDAETLVLMGQRPNGETVLVADENNNNQLTDDRVITVPATRGSGDLTLQQLPEVHITNLQSLYKGKPRSFSQSLLLKPATPQSLEVVHGQYYVGRVKVGNETMTVGVRNIFPWEIFNTPYTLVRFSDQAATLAFKGWPTPSGKYTTGDTLRLNNKWYTLKEVSPFMDYLTLQESLPPYKYRMQLQKNDALARRGNAWVGKRYPAFAVKDGEKMLTNKAFEGKVVFINFWFQACLPCIAEFDGLGQLAEGLKDNKDFAFLSFTFETPETINEVTKQYGLKFQSFSLPKEQCEKLNFNLPYPVNIIIDKKGVVKKVFVGGHTFKEEATRFIQTGILPHIREELSKPGL
jgi:peroxiredoxin